MNLKNIFFATLILATACSKNSTHEGHDQQDANTDSSPNQALYDQVMSIHDEVMPKSQDCYKLKKELEEKIAATPNLIAEKKKELEMAINQLDSADRSMMDWMHKFNPLPDSADQETARAYLESEIEKINKVKSLVNESIDKAKEIIKN